MQEDTVAVLVPWDESAPIQSLKVALEGDGLARIISPQDPVNVISSLLIRPSAEPPDPGLYAHHYRSFETRRQPNVRATRLAMACGLFQFRLYGDVILTRGLGRAASRLDMADVLDACSRSCDLRNIRVPTWLGNGARNNYHDAVVLTQLSNAMSRPECTTDNDDEEQDEREQDDGDLSSEIGEGPSPCRIENSANKAFIIDNEFVTTVPLCLHCRRPASQLCPDCQAAYFCAPPATCRTDGWSHECLCSTWKVYTERRSELSTFPFDNEWYKKLTTRDFQTSKAPYEAFVSSILSGSRESTSWWHSEMDGWRVEGHGTTATKSIDIFARVSYMDGFHPITGIPPERCVTDMDAAEAELLARNEVGLLRLQSWRDYYRLRQIPHDSPCALLLTFPLTLYHAIVEYGQVPCTVARTILKRPLRIHIVGAEKETNFVDLFKEVSFLLPDTFELELVFVVHEDMQTSTLRHALPSRHVDLGNVTPTLKVWIARGSYGDTLDPNFDCGSGPPDMIVAFNAGLFAYDSWRSVLTYLDRHDGVVAVFTDYNEFSGVQCASLGGLTSRNSVTVNPFRQPRAMPVFCMNLPQFCNGFLYVLNGQTLE